MTARTWLGRARSIDKEMRVLERAKREAKEALLHITQKYDGDGAQSTKDPHKMDKIAEYIGLLDEKHNQLIEARKEITECIYKLEDGRVRAVLMSYYVRGKSLEQIAFEENYSYRHVKRLRRQGEDTVEKLALHVPASGL